MKIAWTRLKGACLLLLGMATTGGGRSFAADINTLSFATLAGSSSATTAGKTEASPFKDESTNTSVKALPFESAMSTCSPSCTAGCACDDDNFVGAPGRFWFRGEYLHWWTNGAHLPPVVSTLIGPNRDTLETVFGDREIRDGSHDGYRVDFGMWLDCTHCWGLEADYFDVTGRPDNYDSGFTNGIGADGNPFPIVRPYWGPNQIGTNGVQVSGVGFPNVYVGRVTVETNDYFQSAGMWFRRQLRASEWSTNNCDTNWTDSCARTFRLDFLGGYRFTRLVDKVNIQHSEVDIEVADPNNGNIGIPGAVYSSVDSYRAGNSFNGGELGLNGVYTHGRWSLDVVGKAAIGVNSQYVKMCNQGVVDNRNNVPGDVTVQGLGPGNATLQDFSRNRFSAIPELTLTGGYQITDHVKVTVGYDLLYWSGVVRAAGQINVDPVTGLPYGTQVGIPSTAPAFTWNESHYFAQGLRLGGELRY